MAQEYLVVRGAREHNLKDISVRIPRNRLTVITGLSGSGKSSLAFDTIYAEGQRRYVESLSAYARQFLGLMEKPDVDAIEGLSPAISIEQKTQGQNPRSTVGTVTEIYDYLRLLWARVGVPHCPNDGSPVTRQSAAQITEAVLAWPEETRIEVLAPLVRGRKGEFRDLLEDVRKRGFVRVRVDGETYDVAAVPALNRRQNHDIAVVVDRLVVRETDRSRLNDSIETALKAAEGVVEVVRHPGSAGNGADGGEPRGRRGVRPVTDSVLFSERFACPVCGLSFPELEPRQFSFNSPFGACPDCHGVGTRREVNAELILGDPSISILEGVILPWGEPTGYLRKVVLPTLAKAFKFDLSAPWGELSEEARRALLHGASGRFRFAVDGGRGKDFESEWEGVLKNVERRYRESASDAIRESLEEYMIEQPCQSCGGKRLRPESLAVLVHGRSIGDVLDLPVSKALAFFESIPLRSNGTAGVDPEIAGPILKEVGDRLRFLRDVGLDYLTLGRGATSLSGGETQRIRLATQIGSRLVGVLYILDEPSIGLHQRDNARLLRTLKGLRDLGNTVIVVEHDDETIRAADHVIDLGPRAGRLGGEVVAEGGVAEILRHPSSLTARYLRGDLRIPVPPGRRLADRKRRLRVIGARANNLQNVTAEIPLGLFVAVTGVSGSGKSTLVTDILYRALARHFYRAKVVPGSHARLEGLDLIDKVIDIDQSPSGGRPGPTRPPTPACSPRSGSCSPPFPKPRCEATGPDGSPSMSRAAVARRVRAMGWSRSRCISCPMCTCPARSVRDGDTTARRSRSATRAGASRTCSSSRSPTRSSSSGPNVASRKSWSCSTMSVWDTSTSARPLRPSRGARRSGSSSPPSWRSGTPAGLFTSSTSRRPACTSRMCACSSRCSTGWWTRGTASSSSSTTSKSSRPPTGSSISGRKAERTEAGSWPRGRRRRWPGRRAATPGGF